jgi:hypothetical protein
VSVKDQWVDTREQILLNNLRPDEIIRGSVEPSEGKGGESDVAILRFSMW